MRRFLICLAIGACSAAPGQASSILSVEADDDGAPSIVSLGAPSEQAAETSGKSNDTSKRQVTPMIMRGGLQDGHAPSVASEQPSLSEGDSNLDAMPPEVGDETSLN